MKSWRDLLCEVFQVAEVAAEEALPLDDFGLENPPSDSNKFVVVSVATHELLIGAISAVQEFEAEEVEDAEHF